MSTANANLQLLPLAPRRYRFDDLLRYLEQMTALEPYLPPAERADLQAWYRSPDFTRDSDWVGWRKYLGPRPTPPTARLREVRRRR